MGDPVAAGRVLGGRYQLRSLHARGGMASVWVADDRALARDVAVKVLHPELGADDAVRVRFRREALAAARLSHPNIVAVYDAGEDDGTSYIVMELVDGEDLRRRLDGAPPMPIDDVVEIASQIADALDFAHRNSIVHRDMKPANVLVDARGHVKVADFGIAKAVGGDGDLTRTHTIVGTARYLAPEQVTGAETDARTDVYGLALLVFEMLTGRPAFESDNDIGAAVARLTVDPPVLADHRADVPDRVAQAVARGLARDPDDRWPAAGAFKDALHGRARLPPAPRPVEAAVVTSSRRGWVVAAVVTVLVALVGGAAWALWPSDGDPGSPPTAPVAVVAAEDFDPPPGDGEEGASTVAAAIDGDPASGWRTETYASRDFGRAKPGVGLRLDLGEQREVDSISVDTDLPGWSAEVFVAGAAGSTLEAWGEPRATGADLDTTERFDLTGGSTGRFVLLWLTNLPVGGRLVVNEVRVAA